MPMKRSFLAALAIPIAAALAVGGLVFALRPSALLHPSTVLHSPAVPSPAVPSPSAAGRSIATCIDRNVPNPFVGVAINPPIALASRSFGDATRSRLSVIEFYSGFPRQFPRYEAAQAAGRGALPMIQLNPRNVSLARIAAGGYDSYLRTYAAAVRDFRCRVALSFGHEMNGSWYSWGLPGTRPATFIAAWRHIYRLFQAEHARNVIWSWDPDHVWKPNRGSSWARTWWPGASYVDWIGIDGYLRPGQTFASMFGHQLARIRTFSAKPVFIAETGVQPGAGQASQIAGLFAAVRRYHLAGLIWFDVNRLENWRLEGDPSGLAAFHEAAAGIGA